MSRSERTHLPEQPSLSPSAHVCLAWAVGVCAGTRIRLQGVPLIACFVVACVFGVTAFLLSRGKRGRGAAACALTTALLLGLSACTLRMASVEASARMLSATPVSTWTITISSDQSETRYGLRCRARVRSDAAAADVWLTSDAQLAMGEQIRCVGTFVANADDERGHAAGRRGIAGTVRSGRILERGWKGGPLGALRKVRAGAIDELGPEASDGRALVAALCLGYRRGLDARGLDELFAHAGIAHLVAVSGMHLMVVGLLAKVAAGAAGASMKLSASVQMAVAGAFCLLCGMPMSALRAWLMLAASSGAQLAGRRQHALSSLGAAALLCLAFDPLCLFDLGFQLSVLTVAALSLFGSYTSYLLERSLLPRELPRAWPRRLRGRLFGFMHAGATSLGASATAQAASFPLAASAFSRISLVGPVSSALLAAPATALMATGLAALPLLSIPVLGNAALFVVDALGSVVVGAARILASLPLASMPVSPEAAPLAGLVVGLVGIFVLVRWPDPPKRSLRLALAGIVAICALVLGVWRFGSPPRMVVLDVGQGDAILIQDGGSALLVDCGPGTAVTQALARQHVLHLDAVILTHLHDDHYGGLAELKGLLGDGPVMVSRGAADGADGLFTWLDREGIAEISHGDVVRVGRFELRMVWPREAADGTTNADSVHFLLVYDDGTRRLTALLTGDGEHEELAAILRGGEVGDIDVLKVGHHGSAISIEPAQARALDPEVSVASAGAGNEYGHPSCECVDALEAAGSLFLCTIDEGDIEVRPGERGAQVMGVAAL